MNIIVCVKEAVDLAHVRINESTREPLLAGLPLEIEALSKNATEEAIRVKGKHGGKVVAISAGAASLRKTIKEVLAMGADEALLLTGPSFESLDENGIAKVLAGAIAGVGDYSLVLLGEGSADNYSGLIPSKLSEMLEIPCVTGVRELTTDGSVAFCVGDREDGYEVVEVPLTAIIAGRNETNVPHLPSLTDILKASKKPVQELGPEDLGLDESDIAETTNLVRRIRTIAPSVGRRNILLEGDLDEQVTSLVASLLTEGAISR